jgi:hypothetical protein
MMTVFVGVIMDRATIAFFAFHKSGQMVHGFFDGLPKKPTLRNSPRKRLAAGQVSMMAALCLEVHKHLASG